MDWTEDPATEQQITQLKKLGFVVGARLSLTEAASLIRQYKKNPPHALTPSIQKRGASISGSSPSQAQLPNSHSRDNSRGESATTRACHLIDAAGAEAHPVSTLHPTPHVEADAASSVSNRLEFWLDTCRDVKEMGLGSVQVYELRQKYGCRFVAPSREQVQDILEALDAAAPAWEREHPEMFYQTLELNFPALVRAAAAHSGA